MKKFVNVRILADVQTFRRISYISCNVFKAAENAFGADEQLNIFQLTEAPLKAGDIVIIDTDASELLPDAFVIRTLRCGLKAIWILVYTDVCNIPDFMPLGLHAVVLKKRLEAELTEILKRLF